MSYAHQGGAWEWPSSTLFAIRQALRAGATAIELDVHGTADGELVVCHDATVDRTTDGRGRIADLTLAQLKELDNAYWFIPGADVTPGRPAEEYPYRGRAATDPDFRIATLREVLETFPGVVLNLDIKQTAPVVAPYESALAAQLAEYGRTDDVIVASFLDSATDAFSAAAPGVPTSAGTLATAAFWQAVHAGTEPAEMRAVALQVPERQGDLVVVDEAFVGGRTSTASPSTCGRSTTSRRWNAWSTWGWTASSPTCRPSCPTCSAGPASPGRGCPGRRDARGAPAQPRPQLGFFPWFAFFLARSLRFTVRFDIGTGSIGDPVSSGDVERPGHRRPSRA